MTVFGHQLAEHVIHVIDHAHLHLGNDGGSVDWKW
jgi:hypothetical protein